MKYLGLLTVLVVFALLVLVSLNLRARSSVENLTATLLQVPSPVARTDLPEQIRVYAARAGADAARLPHHIRLRQSARIQMTDAGSWAPLEARQLIAVGAPGFVWEATQRLGPFTKVKVTDSYVAGEGRLRVDLLGALRVVDASGADIDRSEAMRYLAELPWAPDAMLGNPDLRWQVLAPDRVEVSLDAPGGKIAVAFLFDEAGDIVEVFARNRPALGPDGTSVLQDWRCLMSDYGPVGGRRIPRQGEAGYVVDGVYAPYWEGRIDAWSG
jgi:hypothetical protein